MLDALPELLVDFCSGIMSGIILHFDSNLSVIYLNGPTGAASTVREVPDCIRKKSRHAANAMQQHYMTWYLNVLFHYLSVRRQHQA
jgi:hypothetical protein